MKHCKKCNNTFNIEEEDHNFYQKMGLTINGKSYPVPEPTICPHCREQRRLAWRNERNIYKRNCELCKKTMLSIYSPDKEYTVYCTDCWWSDTWNPFDYGKEYDFNRSYFEQFDELIKKVPQLSLMNVKCENSDYANQSYQNKNCYMTIATDLSEDCYYLDYSFSCTNCTDSLGLHDCKYCYQCIDCTNSYECTFSQDLAACHNCSFSRALRNCKKCFGCTNLRNKEYHIFNRPVSKEEWEEKVEKLTLTQTIIEDVSKRFKKERLKLPHLYAVMNNCSECTGNYLSNSKNSHHCYDGKNIENSKYCSLSPLELKNCYDISGGGGEFLYESYSIGPGQNNRFCGLCWSGNYNLSYCLLCMNNSHDLFGCIGMRHKSFCILNKQYSEEAYYALVPQIIEHMKSTNEWGKFFNPQLSPFGYNETAAQENYPLTKKEAIKQGFKWSEYKNSAPTLPIKPANEIPETYKHISDDVLNYAYECEISHKPFKFIKQELEFYKKYNLPLPKKHPEVRAHDRLQARNPKKLWKRSCDQCNKEIKTTYAPEREEIVYCEECYLKEVY